MTDLKLMELAVEARKNSYAPYSDFHVGAVLLGKSGRVYTGCNVENAGYTPTNCAERTALFKAVSEGEREFTAIAVVGGKEGKITGSFPPCGVCRQVMREFVEDDFMIYMGGAEGYSAMTMTQLLPAGFKASEHMA